VRVEEALNRLPAGDDRVFAAAEQISAERRPTVSTVRALAGVSNADATRYLKEWAEEKSAAGGQVAAAPAALLEQAARLAGACWAEASALADGRHAAAEATWVQEKKNLTLEIAELVTDLDKAGAEKDAAVTELTARIAALEAQVAAAGAAGAGPGGGAGGCAGGIGGGGPAGRGGGPGEDPAAGTRCAAGPRRPCSPPGD
jgi:hypothetical protein